LVRLPDQDTSTRRLGARDRPIPLANVKSARRRFSKEFEFTKNLNYESIYFNHAVIILEYAKYKLPAIVAD
jgi:hypothetical protein